MLVTVLRGWETLSSAYGEANGLLSSYLWDLPQDGLAEGDALEDSASKVFDIFLERYSLLEEECSS